MKHLALVFCIAMLSFAATNVTGREANDRIFNLSVSGTYLLTQHDGYLRILTLSGDGAAFQLSPQEKLLGFSTGQGAWSRTGEDSVTARIIDFTFDRSDGKPTGVGDVSYELKFSEMGPSGYRRVIGAYAGKEFAYGQNPLAPQKTAVREFGVEFTGERVSPRQRM